MKPYKYLDKIAVFFVVVLLLSNITAVKVIGIGSLILPASVILFPLVYLLGDIITEVYGYARARRIIWFGFAASVLMSLVFIVVALLPAAPDWQFQQAYLNILGMTPRFVLASLLAYLVGQFLNSFVLSKMKTKMAGKNLWMRTLGSSVLGQAADTVLFIIIAFNGLLPNAFLPMMIVSQYVVRVGIEAMLTPITYVVVKFLKRTEQEDHFDHDTKFNPFNSLTSF